MCSGILSSIDGDECVCDAPRAVFSRDTAGVCECNADEWYQITEDEDDCVKCYGIGASVEGSDCVCDATMNVEMSSDDEGKCVCLEVKNMENNCLIF